VAPLVLEPLLELVASGSMEMTVPFGVVLADVCAPARCDGVSCHAVLLPVAPAAPLAPLAPLMPVALVAADWSLAGYASLPFAAGRFVELAGDSVLLLDVAPVLLLLLPLLPAFPMLPSRQLLHADRVNASVSMPVNATVLYSRLKINSFA
jgi:hypothetical protein